MQKEKLPAKLVVRTKKCVICGQEFTTSATNRLTCGAVCAKERHNQCRIERLRGNGVRDQERTCKFCGKTFGISAAGQLYCSYKCRYADKKQRDLRASMDERTCVVCHTRFAPGVSSPRKTCSPSCAAELRCRNEPMRTIRAEADMTCPWETGAWGQLPPEVRGRYDLQMNPFL